MSRDILLRVTFWRNDMKNTINKEKKKKKTAYVDDGSRIADMSCLDNIGFRGRGGKRSTFKEQFATYISTVKLMILPMLITMAIISAAFLILYLLL